ncbi:hypothetical protein [Methanobacterium sp. MBAC-LM]|uniref:hypothetical protein n=1 Tax=Methanobacterium sp. MBAC-LM TaxID=3412034 RepID=UPI003C731677
MTIKDCRKGLDDINQIIYKDCIKLDDPNYAIYKINKDGELTPLNKAANKFIVSKKPLFDKEAQDKILEEEGYLVGD